MGCCSASAATSSRFGNRRPRPAWPSSTAAGPWPSSNAAWSSRSVSTSQRRKGASMALHTADELTERLSRRRGDFRWRGQVLENVIEHPDFMPTLLSWGGWLYQAAFDAETAETMVARPDFNGEDCHVFWPTAPSAEGLLQNLKAAQLLAERAPLTGYASIGRDELHALLVATHDLDRERGTAYHERVTEY